MKTFLFIAIFLLEALALSQGLVVGSGEFKDKDLAPYLEYYCSSKNLSIAEASQVNNFKRSATPIHFSYMVDQQCWVRFTVENTSADKIPLYFEHQQTLTAELTLYENSVMTETIGYEHDFKSREIQSAKPTFKIEAPPGKTTYYISQRSKDQMWLHYKVWAPQSFYQGQAAHYFINGGFVILALGLAFYNLLQFSIHTRKTLFCYVSYLIFAATGHMFVVGYLKQFIWHDNNMMTNHFGLLSIQLAFLSAYGFIYIFLDLKKKLPILSKGLFAFVAFACTAITSNLLGYYTMTGAMNLALLIFGSLYMISISIILALKGDREAKFFSIAWGFMFSGVICLSLLYVGVLPAHPLIENSNIMGTAIQMVLLSFAIADQIKQTQVKMKSDREHALDQLEKMVYPHQLKQIKQGGILEDTMPCERSEAIVLCFDIVNSSQLDPEWSKEFTSEVLEECQKKMEDGLGAEFPEVKAYRIKELGDGFLCSIGFPFKVPSPYSQANIAIDLAKAFVDIYESVAQKYPHMNNLLCSIGIAKGEIEGFFTVSEPKHYEMFGRSIVLATRYENIRKKFQLQKNKHLVVIQEAVFDELNTERACQFKLYNLHRELIRDDQSAKRFYYLNLKARNRNMIHARRSFRDAMPKHGSFIKKDSAS